MTARVPAQVLPPGAFIQDELTERGLSRSDFAQALGWEESKVTSLLEGTMQLTDEVAQELGAALGIHPQVWINLETSYRKSMRG